VNVVLVPASQRDESTLANLLQLYIHDFSEFLGTTPSEEGRFEYPALQRYWREATRTAFLIRAADALVGFALVARGSVLTGDPAVYDLAEFFVVRGVRRRGVGRAAAHEVFRAFGGAWEVRVRDFNVAARCFWRDVIGEYTGGAFALEGATRADGSRSDVFRFMSAGRARL
jgi:predicted acetyltransferase